MPELTGPTTTRPTTRRVRERDLKRDERVRAKAILAEADAVSREEVTDYIGRWCRGDLRHTLNNHREAQVDIIESAAIVGESLAELRAWEQGGPEPSALSFYDE